MESSIVEIGFHDDSELISSFPYKIELNSLGLDDADLNKSLDISSNLLPVHQSLHLIHDQQLYKNNILCS